MIVGKQKSMDEIWEMIKPYKKILVFGCNTCVAVCHQGGNKEAEIMASLLQMRALQEECNMEILNAGIERQCEHEFFASAEDDIAQADAVLSTACGVQFMAAKYGSLPVFPGLDTCFMGAVDQIGVFLEKCQACGQCVLGLTAGICPVSRCAKRVLNGPCGGSSKGKCEIGKDIDCAWQLIVDRLKALGRLGDYEKLASIKDWSHDRAGGPRKFIREDIQV